MMLDACLIGTLVPGIPHLQVAPHPVLQAVRLGHILLRRHTRAFFLVANFHMTSPFLQTFTEWEMKWQPAVLIRICFDKVPILNSGHLMGRWSWDTVPGGRRIRQRCSRESRGGGVHRINAPQMIYRAPEVILWIRWSKAACPRGLRGVLPNGPDL